MFYHKTMPRIRSYRKIKRNRRVFRKLFVLFLWLCVLGFIGMVSVFAYFAKDLPNPEQITERRIIESTKIYDRTGKILLYDVHGEEKRTVIPFEEIPQQVKDATLVIEDDNFYHHFGLDWKGILRAAWANFRGQKIAQGGSTITQQFIKNAILTPERTFTRKIKEAILAIEMEIKYSKDEIFDFYLNQVPYGSNAYGIEAAAQTFFNKNAKDLILAENALLAALPKAPSYYSPYGSHFDELKARQEYILERMNKFGYITEEELNKAKKEELEFNPAASGIKAPHFVMYVREYLEEKYGKEYMEKAGLKVYTTKY
jgi:penicillin-binding protein 1A